MIEDLCVFFRLCVSFPIPFVVISNCSMRKRFTEELSYRTSIDETGNLAFILFFTSFTTDCKLAIMTEEESSKQNAISFLDKLYTILEEESPEIISWSSSGDSFIIYSPQLFSQNIMGKYFKSNKFNSFVRQLNFYGFRKSTRDQNCEDRGQGSRTWEFKHPSFIRGRKDLMSKIHRKQIGDTDSELESRIVQLENESHYLYNLVNELLIWKVILLVLNNIQNDVCSRYPSLTTESMLDGMKQVPVDYVIISYTIIRFRCL